jgi:uncharacterized protein (TIGR02246 family)
MTIGVWRATRGRGRQSTVGTSAEDREAISDLLARYCLYFDQGAAAEWASLYCEDGEFRGAGQHLQGRPALQAFLEELPPSPTHRLTCNHVVDVDGDRARCHSSVVLLAGGAIVSSGRVVDELRRVDGSWRIARRNFEADAAPVARFGD